MIDCDFNNDAMICAVCGQMAPTRTTRCNCVGSKLRGAGDVVAAVTQALGIAPCDGCKKRQEQLNKLIPFKSQESAQP